MKAVAASKLTLLLLLAAPVSLLVALGVGSVAIDPTQFWRGDAQTAAILDLRLTRALSAYAVGGLLALAGALLQVLVRNPLADPYILGVSGGAATGALLSLLLGLPAAALLGNALAGALLSTLLVFSLSRGPGAWSTPRLLLTGVVVASGWGALISALLALSPQQNVQGMLFWLMGDLGYARYPALGAGALALGVLLAWLLARPLNVLMHGELTALSVGVNLARLRVTLYVLSSLLTAVAVTLAGTIGFVGLVIPHILRLLGGADHRHLVVQAALGGGAFLILADTLARTLVAPLQLPVGAITAFLGVPLFLYLLARRA
jgi:iron complex transport system permease protein